MTGVPPWWGTPLVGEVVQIWGQGIADLSLIFTQFCCEPKTSLKIFINFFKIHSSVPPATSQGFTHSRWLLYWPPQVGTISIFTETSPGQCCFKTSSEGLCWPHPSLYNCFQHILHRPGSPSSLTNFSKTKEVSSV